MKMILRLKAAWAAFKSPRKIIVGREFELEQLVREMYEWTNYKHTQWAKRAKKALDA
jgi:hypothetical protein